MASTGGSTPVHSTSCAAAWCTSMPEPVEHRRTRRRPPPPASASGGARRPGPPPPARLRAAPAGRATPRAAAGGPATPAIPTGVAFTTRSAATTASAIDPSVSGTTAPTGSGQGGRLVGPLGGPVHDGHLGRPGLGQGQHDGPGRPAGARRRGSAGRRGRSRRHGAARTRTPPRRCWSRAASRRGCTTQLTAPSRRATVAALVDQPAATSALCGMVTDSPRMSARRMASSAPARRPAGTSKAKDRHSPSSPSAAKAVLCSSGDSEWATGLPMTPTIVTPGPSVLPDAVHRHGGTAAAQGSPRDLRQLLVGQLLGVGVGERHRRRPSGPARSRARRPAGGCRAAASAVVDGMQIGVGVQARCCR